MSWSQLVYTTAGCVQERQDRERAEKEAELERQKAELEEFERRSRGGRRRRPRRDRNAADKSSSVLQMLTVPALITVLVILLSVFVYWLMTTEWPCISYVMTKMYQLHLNFSGKSNLH